MFTSNQTKEAAFLWSLGWSVASAEGCYSTVHAAISPHSEKANSPQGINGMEERMEDVDLWVVG